MLGLHRIALTTILLAAWASPGRGAPETAEEALTAQAAAWLRTLPSEARRRAHLAFDSGERTNWHYVPRPRHGLALGAMSPAVRRGAEALLARAMGPTGWSKARDVLRLESVLRRDPGRYFVTVFGTPGEGRAWGLRFEGHHISVNLTYRGARLVGATPFFLGTNPAEHRGEDGRLLRPLGREEDLARALITVLPDGLRRQAVVASRPVGDVLYGPSRRPRPSGQGLAVAQLSPAVRSSLLALVEAHLAAAPAETAGHVAEELETSGWKGVRFAWMGSTARGRDHYYRIEGPTMLLEYRNLGNHAHWVWRDPRGDFGAD